MCGGGPNIQLKTKADLLEYVWTDGLNDKGKELNKQHPSLQWSDDPVQGDWKKADIDTFNRRESAFRDKNFPPDNGNPLAALLNNSESAIALDKVVKAEGELMRKGAGLDADKANFSGKELRYLLLFKNALNVNAVSTSIYNRDTLRYKSFYASEVEPATASVSILINGNKQAFDLDYAASHFAEIAAKGATLVVGDQNVSVSIPSFKQFDPKKHELAKIIDIPSGARGGCGGPSYQDMAPTN